MKKVLALILCLIMVAAVAVSTVSADVDNPIDYRELQDYGQLHFYIGEAVPAAEKPNVTDGNVSEDEYTYCVEYSPKSDAQVVTINASETAGYYATEWIKYYMAHDGEKLYMAFEVKDNEYFPSDAGATKGDAILINMGGRDAGSQLDAASRLRYDFYGDASNGLLVNENVTVGSSRFWKDYPNDAWVSPAPSFEFDEHVGNRSLFYDKTTNILTLEVEFNIQAILDYWYNDLEVEDVRLSVFPLVMMYGNSAEGGSDGPIEQGELWFRFNEGLNPMIKMDFILDYPDSAYWLGWVGHIIHFCEEPEPTTAAPTEATTTVVTTPKATTAKVTTAKATTAAATTAAATDAPAATTAAPATTAAAEKGCGGTIALSALALVPMLGAAVVFGKKKED